MNRKTVLKKILSVILSVAMVAGLITVSEPKEVEAAEQLVWSQDFEDSSTLVHHDGTITQSIVSEADNKYLNVNYGGWGIGRTTDSGIVVESGASYKLKFKLNIPATTSVTLFYVWCQDWSSADTNYVQDYFIMPNDERISAATDGWQEVTVDYTPTAGNAKVQFFFECTGTGDVYLDDLQLYKVVPDKEAVDTQVTFDAVTQEGYLCIPTAAGATVRTGTIPVEPSTSYTLTYDVKVENATGWINWWMYLTTFDNGTENGSAGGPAVNANSDWVTQTKTYTTQADENGIMFHFQQSESTNSADVFIDNVKLVKTSDASVVYSEDFSTGTTIVNENNATNVTRIVEDTWVFDATNLDGITGQYFKGMVKIDGNDYIVPLEKSGSKFLIHENFFDAIDASATVPTTSFEIAADTLLVQADPNDGWAEVAGGDRIKVTDALNLAYVDDAWVSVVKTDTEMTFDNIDSQAYLKLTDYASGDTIKTPEITVTAGTTYEFSWSVNTTNITDGSFFRPWYQDWLREGSDSNYTANVNFVPEGDTAFVNTNTNGWVTYTKEYTPTDSNNRVCFYFETWGGSGLDVCIDNIALKVKGTDEEIYREDFATTTSLGVQSGTTTQTRIEEDTWYFDATNLDKLTGSYYAVAAKVDGVATTVVMEKSGSQFVIWPGWFGLIDATATAPTESFEIAADATIYEVTSSGWTAVAGGDEITMLEKLRVVKDGDTWEQEVDPEATYINELSFNEVISDGTWKFASVEALPLSEDAQYFMATIKIDGVDTKVAFENNGTDLLIYPNFFTDVYGGSAPVSSVVIPAGTVFYEITTTGGWPEVLGGTQITATKDISVIKSGDSWTEQVAQEYDITLGFNNVDANGNWLLTADSYETSNTYYKVNVLVDGVAMDVAIENTGSVFYIYPGFFSVFDGTAPTSTFELQEGTVLKPVDPNNEWNEIENADTYKVTDTLTVKYDDGAWELYVAPEEVLSTEARFDKVDTDGTWYFATEATLPASTQAPFFEATVKIDGVDTKVAFQNNGTNLVVWPNFFTDIFGGSKPTSSLVIPKDTVFYEITDAGWGRVAGGTQIVATNEVEINNQDGVWMQYVAPEAVVTADLSLNKVEDGHWYLGATALPAPSTATYFTTTIEIDGVKTQILIENMGTQLAAYSNFITYFGGKAPTSNVKIPAGTVMYEVDSTNGFAVISGGTQIVVTEELKITNEGGSWMQYIPPELELDTDFAFSKNESNSWYFNTFKTLPSTSVAQFFAATVKIDGVDTKIVFENQGTGLVVWPNFFEIYQGSVPTSSLTIPKDTIFYEVTSAGWSNVSGGARMTATNDVYVEKISGEWLSYDKVEDTTSKPNIILYDMGGKIIVPAVAPYEITRLESNEAVTTLQRPGTYDVKSVEEKVESTAGNATASAISGYTNLSLQFRTIGSADEWYLDIKDGSLATSSSSRYYKVPAIVDGKESTIAVEVPANTAGMTIWSGFFNAIDSNLSATPNHTFKIEAGAVMTPVSTSGWTEISGTKIQIQNEITVTKTDVLCLERVMVYILGDVTVDSKIDSRDLVALKKIVTNDANKTTSVAGTEASDMNTGSGVNAEDKRLLCQKILLGDEKSSTAYKVLNKTKSDAPTNATRPIIGYDGPDYDAKRGAAGYQSDMYTDEVFDMIQDLGFNMFVANRVDVGSNYLTAQKILQKAEDYDLQVYLQDAYLYPKDGETQKDTSIYINTPEELEVNAEKYLTYSSFAGYYMYDEPYQDEAPTLFGQDSRWTLEDLRGPLTLLTDYANLSGYVNLFPVNSSTLAWEIDSSNLLSNISETAYKGYLEKALEVGADYLSYDFYLRNNDYEVDNDGFYENIRYARDVANANDASFYSFIQVGTGFLRDDDANAGKTDQSDLTTVQEMYLEANAPLAMGAKGLNYYSLIQPIEYATSKNGEYDLYRSGLINIAGEPNHGENGNANYDYYAAAKKINNYVATIDEVLMTSIQKATIATNSTTKTAVGGVGSYGSIASVTGTDALVGCFDYCGKEAFMVVNTTCDDGGIGSTQNITLNFTEGKMFTYTGMDCVTNMQKTAVDSFTLTVPAGESVLVVLETADSFIK